MLADPVRQELNQILFAACLFHPLALLAIAAFCRHALGFSRFTILLRSARLRNATLLLFPARLFHPFASLAIATFCRYAFFRDPTLVFAAARLRKARLLLRLSGGEEMLVGRNRLLKYFPDSVNDLGFEALWVISYLPYQGSTNARIRHLHREPFHDEQARGLHSSEPSAEAHS